VGRLHVGDRVYGKAGLMQGGAFAEYILIKEDRLVKLPEKVNFHGGASLTLAGLTSLQALRKGEIKAGQNVLILGGSGGTGSLAIQIAKRLGAHVTATTSTKNIQFVKDLGADEIADYSKENWFNDYKGKFDLVYDSIGGSYLTAVQVAKPGGIYVSITGGKAPEGVEGPVYHSIFLAETLEDLQTFNQWVEEGSVKPVVDTVYPFHKFQEAFQHNASGRTRGKVVVTFENTI